jgi:tetratricopeptide (TPR) repeat protein
VRARSLFPALPWAALGLALLAAGCSQEKDAFLNRTFHRLTARDNGWFNANEKLKEKVQDIEDAHKDDFDQVLPVFVYGTEQQAKAAVPDLEKCIDKCSLVIERHSMDIKGKEKNTWIDDAWFVIAKSQFYKRNYSEAERGFTFITRKFKGSNRELESQVWLARTAIELEQFGKARSALEQVSGAKKLPKGFDQGELAAVEAHLEIKRGRVDDAILHLERAVPLAERKRERVRWAFILAQLYELKGQEEKAIQQYASVVKMNPPYEIAFHAQIFQALAFNKGDSKALRKRLMAMLRDDKHIDHFDMIHYALADLDLKERKEPSAIEHLVTSTRVSTTDTKQKAKSFLKLADIHFDARRYQPAQRYYDSTRTLLAEEHARYDEVDTRARVLGDLVEQLAIIAREDSLQALMGLDPDELEKKIRGIIRQREDAELERQRQEELAREQAPPTANAPTPGGGGRGNWYFYDPQQIGRGLSNFRKRWGNRPLEDDWRRKDRSGSALAIKDDEEEGAKEPGKEAETAEWKDPEFYLRDIPKDPEALAASNARICSALYSSGMIYKEQLKDVDNAIESFEVLNNRFEDCRYTPESHYQLFRIYLEKERTGWFSLDGIGSQTYASIILERWPDSEFARLVRDPNAIQGDEARRLEEEAAYREVYQLYRQYAFLPVISACNRVIEGEPANYFRPKYHLLKALATGGLRDMAGYRSALQAVTTGFPGTEEASRAEELLATLDGGGAPKPKPAAGPAFKKGDGPHYYVVVVPNRGTDMNTIKVSVSDFNTSYFGHTPLEVTSAFLDADRQVLLVNPLPNKAKAMEYHGLFSANDDLLPGLNDQGYPAFAITNDNYGLLYQSKAVEAYVTFFQQNYLDRQ